MEIDAKGPGKPTSEDPVLKELRAIRTDVWWIHLILLGLLLLMCLALCGGCGVVVSLPARYWHY
jgi:hypothetical protein